MRNKLVIGNWKMHGSINANLALIHDLKSHLQSLDEKLDTEIVVCPPSAYLQQLSELLQHSEIGLGAQNVSEYSEGAYTGEISTSMLNDFNTEFVLVGHSERRTLFAETDQRVAEKFSQVCSAEMRPVLCCGETLQEREQGNTEQIILSQLEAVLAVAGKEKFAQAVIAYEPIWAIGTGMTASPEQAQSVHAVIRQWLQKNLPDSAENMQLLYGGSVKADNAKQLFAQQDIDGGLIGGAALDAKAFIAICAA
jgi:triosephosphate isomerase